MKRLGVALTACLVFSASAAPAADSPTDVVISYVINADGRGQLIANPVPDGSWGVISWQACGPDGTCQATPPVAGSDRILNVGDAAPGTTFIATATDGSQSFSATSVPYRGRLTQVVPPFVIGAALTRHFVRPLPATWLGGWGGEKPLLQLQACRTRRADTCKVIAASFGWSKCPGSGARIAPRYLDWYLRVAETRVGRDVVLAGRGYGRPEDIEPMKASPITAVATVGKIQAGRGPNRAC